MRRGILVRIISEPYQQAEPSFTLDYFEAAGNLIEALPTPPCRLSPSMSGGGRKGEDLHQGAIDGSRGGTFKLRLISEPAQSRRQTPDRRDFFKPRASKRRAAHMIGEDSPMSRALAASAAALLALWGASSPTYGASFDKWSIYCNSVDNHFASGPAVATSAGPRTLGVRFSNTLFSPGTPMLETAAGKLPVAKILHPETVTYRAEVVCHDGALHRPANDTAQTPGGSDWVCVASRAGLSLSIRSTFDACDGGSLIARRNNPGACPGPDWHLLTSPGKARLQGEPDIRGEKGKCGKAGATSLVG